MVNTILYFIIVLIAYVLLKSSNRKKRINVRIGKTIVINRNKNRIDVLTCYMIAAIFTLYNWIVTSNASAMGGDRLNYYSNFLGERPSVSDALTWVIGAVKFFGGNIYTLFYFTSFICLLIVMLAIRKMELYKPEVLLLLFLSQYVLFSFTGLKQAYANSFAFLFFYYQFSEQIKGKNILSLLCIIVAFAFHSASIILVPIFIIFNIKLSRRRVCTYFILFFLIGLFFEPVMITVSRIISPIFPSVGGKIITYFASGTNEVAEGGSIYMFLKGMPYYLIGAYGIIYRRRMVNIVKDYDKYLIVSITCSFFYLMSIYNSWMMRFIYFFLPIVFLMFCKIEENLKDKSQKIVSRFIALLLFIVTARFLLIVFANGGSL